MTSVSANDAKFLIGFAYLPFKILKNIFCSCFQIRASSHSRTLDDCATSVAAVYVTVSKDTTYLNHEQQWESRKNAERERKEKVFSLRRRIR